MMHCNPTDSKMLFMDQVLLLAICVFLHLIPAGALRCRFCYTKSPTKEQKDCKSTLSCDINPESGTCISIRGYQDGELQWIDQDCRRKSSALCGITAHYVKGMSTETKCCEDNDFCNQYL
ncbi:hypothetical protein JRQ81_004908 [Phrynocephalus forsythii]|uniref:Uncharacterized protein n=1 Tax=Phrynocephalus forsythii TaxID=171643 RepID=A0A9Q0Y4L4_9SAUR|nr:hypothetical protein JRQ81_004908 [Phrynocephalus forsythii]